MISKMYVLRSSGNSAGLVPYHVENIFRVLIRIIFVDVRPLGVRRFDARFETANKQMEQWEFIDFEYYIKKRIQEENELFKTFPPKNTSYVPQTTTNPLSCTTQNSDKKFRLFTESYNQSLNFKPHDFFFEYPSVPHRPSQFNTSVQPRPHLFSTQYPSIQHQNPSTPPQFNTPLRPTTSSVQRTPQFNTKNLSVQQTDGFLVLNWGGVELRDMLNWGVFGVKLGRVLNWGLFAVELRNFGGWKGVALLCWPDVWNLRGPIYSDSRILVIYITVPSGWFFNTRNPISYKVSQLYKKKIHPGTHVAS